MSFRITGLVAAAFTPMHADGRLNLDQVGPIVDYLIAHGFAGIYVCGSTGEGPLLTSHERRETARAYVQAAAGRLPIVIQVGHNSLAEARDLAAHAQQIGADAISAVSPSYFRPASLENLLDCLDQVLAGAPELPFYYYHIPRLSGVGLDMVQLLELAEPRLPTLVGIKYSEPTVYEFQACVEHADGRFNMLFGSDEMLLSGLCGGADGAVGSTFNIAPRLYQAIVDAYQRGDILAARREQARSVELIRRLYRYRGQPAFKAAMKMIGLDCGPNRLPQVTLSSDEYDALQQELETFGFFAWNDGVPAGATQGEP